MNALVDMFLPISEISGWIQILLSISIKGAIVLSVVYLINIALRRASAAARHLIWTLGLASLIILPVLQFMLPEWQVPILLDMTVAKQANVQPNTFSTGTSLEPGKTGKHIQKHETGQVTTSASPISGSLENSNLQTRTGTIESETPSTILSSLTIPSFHWTTWLLIIWLTGVSVVLFRLLIGMIGIWWMTRRSKYITDASWIRLVANLAKQLQLTNHVALIRNNQATVPMTWGIRQPVILLPADADQWSLNRRRIVLMMTVELVNIWFVHFFVYAVYSLCFLILPAVVVVLFHLPGWECFP